MCVLTLFPMSDLYETFTEGSNAMDAPTHLTPSPGLSGCSCPPRLQEETWRIGGVRFPDMES